MSLLSTGTGHNLMTRRGIEFMENNKLFVYGILRKGFPLDLSQKQYGCKYIGKASIAGAVLHRIGHGVGLRFVTDPFKVAHGEIFEIPARLWAWLDDIERNGHTYERRIVLTGIDRTREVTPTWVYEHIYFNKDGYERLPIIESGNFELYERNHDDH